MSDFIPPTVTPTASSSLQPTVSSSSWRVSMPRLPSARALLSTLAVAGGVCAIGFFGYRMLIARRQVGGSAEKRKRQGVELYRRKDYRGAIREFEAAVAELLAAAEAERSGSGEIARLSKESKEFVATIYNNIAACYDEMDQIDDCIHYCSEALSVDSTYWKPMNRRARCYHKQQRHRQALSDYVGALSRPPNEQQKRGVEMEIERVLTQLVTQESAIRFPRACTGYKPIPQHVVYDWLYSTVVDDPLLKRLESFVAKQSRDEKRAENGGIPSSLAGLDKALWLVMKSRFDEVLAEAKRVYTDEQKSASERVLALLLYARFLFFHNERLEAVAAMGKLLDGGELKQLWDQALAAAAEAEDGEAELLERTLHTLRVTLAETTQEAEEIVAEKGEDCEGNADAMVVLGVQYLQNNATEDAQRLFKRVVKIRPEHPVAKYYAQYVVFLLALRSQEVSEVHNAIRRFDEMLQESSQQSVLAQILLTKICLTVDSTDMALAMTKQILTQLPNCAFAMYTYGILSSAPTEGVNLQQIRQRTEMVAGLEKVMHKVLEMDPNYWEPYRMLAILHRERSQMSEALAQFDKAIALARKREEFEYLLSDRLLVEVLKERIDAGLPIPAEVGE